MTVSRLFNVNVTLSIFIVILPFRSHLFCMIPVRKKKHWKLWKDEGCTDFGCFIHQAKSHVTVHRKSKRRTKYKCMCVECQFKINIFDSPIKKNFNLLIPILIFSFCNPRSTRIKLNPNYGNKENFWVLFYCRFWSPENNMQSQQVLLNNLMFVCLAIIHYANTFAEKNSSKFRANKTAATNWWYISKSINHLN